MLPRISLGSTVQYSLLEVLFKNSLFGGGICSYRPLQGKQYLEEPMFNMMFSLSFPFGQTG